MKVVNVEINNFRGIKSFNHFFGANNLILFAGRGNSCKTSILEAIALCLTPKWNPSISDSDFFNGDTANNIEIKVILKDIPTKFFQDSKYGLFIRKYDEETKEYLEIESTRGIETLTIEFKADNSLEPSWKILGQAEEVVISAKDREQIGMHFVADYADSQLAWTRGSPLYTLHSQLYSGDGDSSRVILNVVRKAKDKLDEENFEEFSNVINELNKEVKILGGDMEGGKAAIDIKDLSFKSNIVSLHRDNKVPFKYDGKGNKRLISIAAQHLIASKGGIILIDEIEQGLEPDRIKHLVRTFSTNFRGQIFLTTHSASVIEEVDVKNLFIVKIDSSEKGKILCSSSDSDSFQKLYRSLPEAVYAGAVICCEGSTEVGICRALDEYRINHELASLSQKGIVYIQAGGDNLFERAKLLSELNKKVCIFMDSDKDNDLQKDQLRSLGVSIFDWEKSNSIEQQIFKDVNFNVICEILTPRYFKHKINLSIEIKKDISQWDENLKSLDNLSGREILGNLTKRLGVYKRINEGYLIGKVLLDNLSNEKEHQFKKTMDDLQEWIENCNE